MWRQLRPVRNIQISPDSKVWQSWIDFRLERVEHRVLWLFRLIVAVAVTELLLRLLT